ncbi:hypothetical protein N474_20150 [Pseudoalteromonas luteoviolacea CPMOR-2]|uniref:Integron-associated effector binding protein domain-containing protein n=1 Tax=Pseudoalteromonas luteoviolacea DSM 6061 TaxID=1365250 RepID=A0A166YVY1_9GAMM|nr:hypothetical protein [Pseudoalteromonas luteoviolacea]KZN43576.1 hypothetical protein N475_08380 [Pseudoalteromonas luteoviolacea DSM 6061]KZN53647.1 hypothetical protein N474_20150 [Pseudoalteromonas luteoviolacea CPMOR-2]MBE0386543.1 hypothetical protein [Pseudoalteromonas luteoviolacea DSM 6061]
MNLASSILVSGVIVLSVWGVALLQPTQAVALTKQKSPTLNNEQTQAAIEGTSATSKRHNLTTKHLNKIIIQGNTANIATSDVTRLWQDFSDNERLNGNLKKAPNAVYVYYRNFSANFDSATVTIGYPVGNLTKPSATTTIASADYHPLLSRKKYTQKQLEEAWQAIDYRRNIQHVVEVHYLSENGDTTATEMLIRYGEQ